MIYQKSSSKNKDLEATAIQSLRSMTEKYPAVYKRYEAILRASMRPIEQRRLANSRDLLFAVDVIFFNMN